MTTKFVEELHERGLFEEAQAICKPLGLRVDELRTGGTAQVYVGARRAMAKLLRGRGWSYPMIGDLLNRNHSTVMVLLGGGT